jgi:hypothetical protein
MAKRKEKCSTSQEAEEALGVIMAGFLSVSNTQNI